MKEGNFGEIRKAVEHNKKLSIKNDEKDWEEVGVYDSSLKNFGDTFVETLPANLGANIRDVHGFLKNPEIFKTYIEQTLSKKKKKDLTAIELGGPGSGLFRGFTKDFFKKTAGVCLRDIRSKDLKKRDTDNNHFLIEGDILDSKNNEKVTKILGTEKTDLIISRMIGPLKEIDKHPAILDRIVRNWYNMLNKNGLMFIQFIAHTPFLRDEDFSLVSLIKKWSIAVKEKCPEIDINVSVNVNGGSLRLHKKADAPEELPRASELFRE